MGNTLLFCANCTWEIIPMLLGAWVLGSMFWWLLRGSGLTSRIKELEGIEAVMKQKNTDLQVDLDSTRYHLDKSKNLHTDLKNRFANMELKLRATEEQLRELKG